MLVILSRTLLRRRTYAAFRTGAAQVQRSFGTHKGALQDDNGENDLCTILEARRRYNPIQFQKRSLIRRTDSGSQFL
jgi:hypothetical protein